MDFVLLAHEDVRACSVPTSIVRKCSTSGVTMRSISWLSFATVTVALAACGGSDSGGDGTTGDSAIDASSDASSGGDSSTTDTGGGADSTIKDTTPGGDTIVDDTTTTD